MDTIKKATYYFFGAASGVLAVAFFPSYTMEIFGFCLLIAIISLWQ
jgi:hypothetical protein